MANKQSLPDLINNITIEWANERIAKAKKILNDNNIHPSKGSLLPQSLISDQTITNNGIRIDFYASDYYIFIDEGVTGIGGGKKLKPTTGKYKFKTAAVSRAMLKNIQNWVVRRGIPIRKSPDEKTSVVINNSFAASYAIAKSIKRTGIGKTMFWSDTFNEKAYKDLADRIAKKIGGEYTIQLKGI